MCLLYSTAPCTSKISIFSTIFPTLRRSSHRASFGRRTRVRAEARSDGLDTPTVQESSEQQEAESSSNSKPPPLPSAAPAIDKNVKKVVQKTASTFAPRASTATKNPAVPGTALYTLFEVQGYASMLFGGALSFNLIFPSNEPDIWRLMGMWSVWMFTIPSLRARDCSKNEKEALNYLFLLIPLLNVVIPFFWKSFSIVWSADTIAFFVMYAWKLGWLQRSE
ncbi:protein RESISTANCE TO PHYTOPHTHORA 1, chloroplastic [Cocos nucifera]|nr:protein RESISTANCE TO PHYTOPHTHORA 1, chloroplastic [Cocos nucifera]